MTKLEHKLRLLRNTVSLQGSAGIHLQRNELNEVVDFQIIDPTTIVKLFTEEGKTPDPPSPAYQQIWKGYPTIDLTTDQLLLIEHLQSGEIYPGVKSPFQEKSNV